MSNILGESLLLYNNNGVGSFCSDVSALKLRFMLNYSSLQTCESRIIKTYKNSFQYQTKEMIKHVKTEYLKHTKK